MDALLRQRWYVGSQPRQTFADDPSRRTDPPSVDVRSSLPSIFIAERLTARMTPSPARTTRSVSGSINAAAASQSIIDPGERASFMGGCLGNFFSGSYHPTASVFSGFRAAFCWQRAHPRCLKPASMRDSPLSASVTEFPREPPYVWHHHSRPRPRRPRTGGAAVFAGLPWSRSVRSAPSSMGSRCSTTIRSRKIANSPSI